MLYTVGVLIISTNTLIPMSTPKVSQVPLPLKLGIGVLGYPRGIETVLSALGKKSCIWETSNLSTDADSSTVATVGYTKNTKKTKKN